MGTPFDELLERRTKAHDEAKALTATVYADGDRDFTDEEKETFDGLVAEVESLDGRMKRLKQLNDMSPPAVRESEPMPIRQPGDPSPALPTPRTEPGNRDAQRIEIPENCRRGTLRGYTCERFGEDHQHRAYRFGRALFAHLGHAQSRQWCNDHGIELRVQTEGTNWNGGVLVLDQFDSDFIRLVEAFGVFRQFARVVPMASDVMVRDRRTGGLTAYAVGEDSAGTESTMTFDQITLTAKKWMVLATMSSELNEDAIISIADQLMTEIAYAFANKEDDAGFNGDGTSTYNGMVGLTNAFVNLTSTVADRAGQVVGTGNLWTELVLLDFNKVVGLLPEYADTPNVRWYMHKTFWGQVAQTLAYAAGGNTTTDISAGMSPTFLGYPVQTSQVLPKVAANDSIVCFLGDLNLAADLGDRRGTTVAFSDVAYVNSKSMFERDSIAVKATTRYDINVHDVGNQSGTAASRVPGPIVCLSTAAS